MQRNFQWYAPFAATERTDEICSGGADWQEMHEILRSLALRAWQQVQAGNRIRWLIWNAEPRINVWLSADEIRRLMSADGYTYCRRTPCGSSQITDSD